MVTANRSNRDFRKDNPRSSRVAMVSRSSNTDSRRPQHRRSSSNMASRSSSMDSRRPVASPDTVSRKANRDTVNRSSRRASTDSRRRDNQDSQDNTVNRNKAMDSSLGNTARDRT